MARYTAQLTESSTCPGCEEKVTLLTPARADDDGPAFYICACGFIGQVGVGRVRKAGQARQVMKKEQAEALLRYIESLCDEIAQLKGGKVQRTAYSPTKKDEAMAVVRRVAGEEG